MSDKILWRKLTSNDMNAISGAAAPGGGGGGAKHIALGVDSRDFPIMDFLNVSSCQDIDIKIEPITGLIEQKNITFSSQQNRRGGEWRIARQHLDRYPLWTPKYGFPRGANDYNDQNPPVIFIIKISNEYHVRFCMLSEVINISPSLKSIIESSRKNSGIEDFEQSMGNVFKIRIPPPTEESRISPSQTSRQVSQIRIPPVQISPPQTTSSVVTRYIRDSRYGEELKELYEHKCCFCETLIERPHDTPYVESCHIKPLNDGGPDAIENLLILCPNHHIEFDYGSISIDPRDLTLKHINRRNSLHGKQIVLRHQVNIDYLRYHFTNWRANKLMGY